MRLSEHYRLQRTQPTLDFVDVDMRSDVPVFIDPRALLLLPSSWGDECVALIQSFFRTVLEHIQADENDKARLLLEQLHEPNETHLGLSRGESRGRGLGHRSAADVWQALVRSEAAKSGLLEDLEDTILMVEGISSDIISDMTTNIIRPALIEYTQTMARFYGIPLIPDVASGPLWDPSPREWYEDYIQLPVTSAGKVLLVPKAIVRQKTEYDPDEYYRHYILTHLQKVEIEANTSLVRLLRNGHPRVTKKDLEQKYGRGKQVIVRETLKYPDLLRRYRDDKRAKPQLPLDHAMLAESEGTSPPDWDALLRRLLDVPPGRDFATDYERAVEPLLTALFYPALTNPQVQFPIHEGRKRIDITYTNIAGKGFFAWLSQHFAAAHIFVECKNYTSAPTNPELDQLAGRFSPSRGQVGLLIARKIDNKPLFLQRCHDTAADHRGFIIALDDDDIQEVIREQKNGGVEHAFDLLYRRFQSLLA
jgi:hypothetical protein